MRVFLISVLLFFFYLKAFGQTVNFHGRITDLRGNSLAFASVWISEVQAGSLTNEQGRYLLNLKPGIYTFSFRAPGYQPLFQTINIEGNDVNHDLQLYRIAGGKPLQDAADSIIRRVIARRKINLNQGPAYSGHLYSKVLQWLNAVPKNFLKNDAASVFHLNLDRKGLINFSESLADFQTDAKHPIIEQAIAAKTTNNSPYLFNLNKAKELQVDFYKNTLNLNDLDQHAFLSPLADHALSYYRYRLTGQFTDNNRLIDEIQVLPIRKDKHLFSGTIYIIEKEWLLYSADLRLSPDARMEFIDSVHIRQQYVPLNNGNWIPQALKFNFYSKFWGFKYSGLFLQVYLDARTDTALKPLPNHEISYSNKDNYQKDEQFWVQNRPLPLTPEENRFYHLADMAERDKKDKAITDSLLNTKNRLRLLPYLFNGYTWHNNNNNFFWSIPPPNNMVFYNTVEGWGINLRVKFTTIYDSLRSLTIIPAARYGFSDKVLNANLFVNYVYNPYKHASVYGRIGSDFLDLNNNGTLSMFINSLNTLLLGQNYVKLYQSRFIMAGTMGEVANGILLNGQIEYADHKSLFNTTLHTFNKDSVLLTSNNPLDPNANIPLFPYYRALIIRGSVTFTFNQDYTITPAGKFILPNYNPRLRVNYRKGVPGLGSAVNYDFMSVDVFQERLKMGIYGYSAYYFSAGMFLNTKSLYYPDYNQFRGGQSFFFDAVLGSFHFLNFYTYSTDKPYFEVHFEHNFTGVFVDYIPLINKLKLQEIVGGSYLSQGILPDYKEVYFGLKRSVVRLDYGFAFGRFTKVLQGFRLSYNL
ncbi:MAG TPA: hypothetical protein DCO83_05000 [Mucilaginibacter sp.]|nr:hypothetical protein [Mucilaginibacter sp.]